MARGYLNVPPPFQTGGSGNVIGPGTTVAGQVATFADTTGNLLSSGGSLTIVGTKIASPDSSSAPSPDTVIQGNNNYDGGDPGGDLVLQPGNADFGQGGSGTSGILRFKTAPNGDATYTDAVTIGDQGNALSIKVTTQLGTSPMIFNQNFHMEPSEHVGGNTSGGTKFVNWANATTQIYTTTGNNNIAILITGGIGTQADGVVGAYYALKILTGAGGFSVSIIGDIVWANNTPPTLTTAASKCDIFRFYYDGVHYYGSVYGQAFPV